MIILSSPLHNERKVYHWVKSLCQVPTSCGKNGGAKGYCRLLIRFLNLQLLHFLAFKGPGPTRKRHLYQTPSSRSCLAIAGSKDNEGKRFNHIIYKPNIFTLASLWGHSIKRSKYPSSSYHLINPWFISKSCKGVAYSPPVIDCVSPAAQGKECGSRMRSSYLFCSFVNPIPGPTERRLRRERSREYDAVIDGFIRLCHKLPKDYASWLPPSLFTHTLNPSPTTIIMSPTSSPLSHLTAGSRLTWFSGH